jgi:methylmalonyl-CoA mutase
MMHTQKLLEEFPPVSREAWEEAIRADLEGADYERTLIWQTPEKMAVKPYYRAEDLAECVQRDGDQCCPTPLPWVRETNEWCIREEIDAADPTVAHRMAREAIASGVEEVAFRNTAMLEASDLRSLCTDLQSIPLRFEDATESLLDLLPLLPELLTQAPISTGWNPLSKLSFAASVLRSEHFGLIPFTIHGEELQERGASVIEEIGSTLAAGIEFLRDMQAREIDIARASSSIAFSFSIGASYVFQIAKFRAFRSLWAMVVNSFTGDCGNSKARVYARTSCWNKTIYDPHVNILRATTEAMSAVLGGVDSICVAPFDECFRSPSEASRRLARNTQLILKLEAMLGHVVDPAAGSYCVEVITDFLAREAWKFMQKIEAAGGYAKACTHGQLEESLRDSEVRSEDAVISLQRILTGTNKFANAAERALDRIEPLHASPAPRGAVAYERLRLRTERHAAKTGKAPHILLAEFGDTKMSLARSHFAGNFFACGGFDSEAQKVATANQVANASADVIVLCSSDRESSDMARDLVSLMSEVGRQTPVIIAGNPELADPLRTAPVADFIHTRTNPVDVLSKLQERLGMTI